ncbi:MAG: glycerol-3-phosphate dehydrogenase/oxidase [Acidobacteriota bacterium]
MLEAVANNRRGWDCLIIGGGATGLGTAVEAAWRGYRTLLLEQSDFAKGTSSRSTKLVHGGVRYLRQGHIGLVVEALRERGLLLQNAPHLVHPLAFVIPIYRRWETPYYGTGLKLYDLLSGKRSLGASRCLSRRETLKRVPTLEPNGLRGGVLYYDAQFDDARLAITLVRTAVDLGGHAVNYMPVRSLLKKRGQIVGVVAEDRETGRQYELRSRVVINATGVFSDSLRCLDDPSTPALIVPSQGIHIVLAGSFLPGNCALMVPSTDDGRVFFALPWKGRVLVGTTDTPVEGIQLEPRPLEGEIDFLLTHAARYLARGPSRKDILSAFAGLRPLIRSGKSKKLSSLSRSHALIVSPSGLITIAGGKWTTYRRMGEETVDRAAQSAGLEKRRRGTEQLRLHGWCERKWRTEDRIYGSDAAQLQDLIVATPALGRRLHPRLPYRLGEVVWTARFEMARTLEDVLSRRTRALLLDARASIESAPRAAQVMADELHRGPAWKARQIAEFTALAQGYLVERC